MSHYPAADRRVQKTRALLHEALASLVHEKAYDDIVVKEILARANVGRSTFYAHYRDKNELLERGIRDLLYAGVPRAPEPAGSASDWLLRFSLPFLTRVEHVRDVGGAPFSTGHGAAVHDHLREVLVTTFAGDLAAVRRRRRVREGPPDDLVARHVAATFVLALEWWMTHQSRSARDVNAHFRALVTPVVKDALGE